ncbi:MAG: hypothetical protein ABI592_15935 [Acidobacteriota bacterium]
MNKVLVGLLLGGVLGIFDGLTAWLTPDVRPFIVGIVIGSTIKGIIAGVAAGWFARKVHSVPAGIAFGFAVGLVLAFLVAAMPSETGKHYWFQIMLPGSVLGAVVGWATQRYGQASRGAVAMVAVALALGSLSGRADAAVPVTAAAALERLKGLAGCWEVRLGRMDGRRASLRYRIAGGGRIVLEELFPGTSRERITLYMLDGDELLAARYPGGAGRPTRLRLDAARSSSRELVFASARLRLAGSAAARIRFAGHGSFESEWPGAADPEERALFATTTG